VKKETVPDWLEESMRKHKENIDLLKFKSIDPKQCHCADIYFPDFDRGGRMKKQKMTLNSEDEHWGLKETKATFTLPDFGYYWRKFKNFFKKPFQKRIDRRHRLRYYDSVCKENEELKKKNAELEHEIWRKGVRLDEAYRLLKYAKKD